MRSPQAPDAVIMVHPHHFTSNPQTLAVPTIETAGGSVRCMLAGIHLARRPEQKAA